MIDVLNIIPLSLNILMIYRFKNAEFLTARFCDTDGSAQLLIKSEGRIMSMKLTRKDFTEV